MVWYGKDEKERRKFQPNPQPPSVHLPQIRLQDWDLGKAGVGLGLAQLQDFLYACFIDHFWHESLRASSSMSISRRKVDSKLGYFPHDYR